MKSLESQELRLLLTHRRTLQRKALDLENEIRGTLKAFGLKVGKVSRGRFAARVREFLAERPRLHTATEPMLKARATVMAEFNRLHRMVLEAVRGDRLCARLMTVPGVGPITAPHDVQVAPRHQPGGGKCQRHPGDRRHQPHVSRGHRCRAGIKWSIGMSITRQYRLKLLGESGLFQHFIRGMARLDLAIHHKPMLGNRALPDFVVAPPLSDEFTPGRPENLAQLRGVIAHLRAVARFLCLLGHDMRHCQGQKIFV